MDDLEDFLFATAFSEMISEKNFDQVKEFLHEIIERTLIGLKSENPRVARAYGEVIESNFEFLQTLVSVSSVLSNAKKGEMIEDVNLLVEVCLQMGHR